MIFGLFGVEGLEVLIVGSVIGMPRRDGSGRG